MQTGTSGSQEPINMRVRRWLEDRGGELVCPMCRRSGFGARLTSAGVAGPFEPGARGGALGQLLTCTNCAHVVYFNASRRVQDIGAPTFVIHGSADRYVSASNAYALARAIPRAKLRVLDGAGHLVFIERAEEVNGEVASFLLGVQEAHGVREARLSSSPERKLEGWLRRLPRAIGRSARKLRDRLAR